MSPSSSPRDRPILCYVTDRHSFLDPPHPASHERLLQTIRRTAQAGVDWIQLREKDLSPRACATLTREALLGVQKSSAGHARPARILVNDRLDVALAEGAGGVHLGENSLPVGEAKRLLRFPSAAHTDFRDFLVGVSCHSQDSAISAADSGADYIFFGPVFNTPSKAAYGPPQGLGRLADVCRSISIPVLAIGGITVENAPRCFDAGASGLAAIRLFQDALDLPALVAALR